MRNVELKARIRSIKVARDVAENLGATRQPDLHQVDTYFNCQSGRLKIREIDGTCAELIAYRRSDVTRSKTSHYEIVTVERPAALKELLQRSLGVRAVVDKKRQWLLYENVRIHLDAVAGLGSFLEFEAVLSPDQPEEEGHQVLALLQKQFSIETHHLCPGSYCDMVPSPELD